MNMTHILILPFLIRSLVHPAIDGFLSGPQPGSGPLPAEEQRRRLLPLPPESQAKPGQAAEPGSAAPRGAQGGDEGPGD